MLDYIAGVDAQLSIPFGSLDDDPLIPEVGSVSFTLRDHAGDAITGYIDVPVETTITSWKADITVPASENTISGAKSFERRSVWLQFTVAGKARSKVQSYRLTPFLNHSVEPAQIRSFLGVNSAELPDADLDIFAAYLRVVEDLGSAALTTALSSGTVQELGANTCIRMQAALDVLPSLKTRIAQKETNGVKGFERPTIRDFSEIQRAAQEAYAAARVDALDILATDPVFVVVTQDADPITG